MRMTLTLASAMAAPLESVTIPSMVARSAWARSQCGAPKARTKTRKQTQFFMIPPHPSSTRGEWICSQRARKNLKFERYAELYGPARRRRGHLAEQRTGDIGVGV